MKYIDQDLLAIQEARILTENCRYVKQQVNHFPQEALDKMVDAMVEKAQQHLEEWANAAVEETGYGNVHDEKKLLERFVKALPAAIQEQKYVGLFKDNALESLTHVGVPVGAVAAILPATNATTTAFYTALIAVKSGNVLLVIPDKKALKITNNVIHTLARAAEVVGLPKGALTCMENFSTQGLSEVMHSSAIDFVLNTGCSEYTRAEYMDVKPLIYGGIGSSPVFIEQSADVKTAVQQIVASRSFNQGTLPGAEQYLVVESSVVGEVKAALTAQGAYFMSEYEEKKLIAILYPSILSLQEKCVGKSAYYLATKAGFDVPKTTKVLISVHEYISEEDPFRNEISCPVIAFYQESDWLHACEKCIQLLAQNQQGHTLAIHSKNQAIINEFALKKAVGRIIVNGAAAFSAIGLESNLFPAMTLGGITTGRGFTANNISPRELTYCREVGYGTESIIEKNKNDEEKIQDLLQKIIATL